MKLETQKTNSKLRVTVFVLLATGYWLLATSFPVFAAPTGQSPVKPALAQDISTHLNTALGPFSSKSLPEVTGIIINGILGILGMIFLILLVYAGFRWLLAKGEDTEIKKARGLIEHSIIGLVIVVSCFVVVRFVLGVLQKLY